MNQTQFLDQLTQMRNSYTWTYHNNQVRGVARNGKDKGTPHNPITAVARTTRQGTFKPTARGTSQAAKAIGVSGGMVSSLLCSSNRGNAQVLRGRILQSLGIQEN